MTSYEHLPSGSLRTLLTGFELGESPRWHDGRLWFSDWGAGEVVAMDDDGRHEVIARGLGVPCCFDWLPDGRMLIVDGQAGKLLRMEDDGTLVTHADLHELSQYPWNDIAVDGRGNAYIGNIGFDFPAGQYAPGIIVLVTPDGTVRQVADNVAFPNGLVVTPDNATLILAESYGNRLTAFEIAGDGSLSTRRVWANLGGDYPDGICLDLEGAIWYADVPNQHCVRVREGGEVLQTIDADRGCFACALGGADGRTLFIVAAVWNGSEGVEDAQPSGQVLAAEVSVPGASWP
jgi:sugar lactone lactonase YvrE